MNLRQHRNRVREAETTLLLRQQAAQQAIADFKIQMRQTATPLRMIGGGLGLGFLLGWLRHHRLQKKKPAGTAASAAAASPPDKDSQRRQRAFAALRRVLQAWIILTSR